MHDTHTHTPVSMAMRAHDSQRREYVFSLVLDQQLVPHSHADQHFAVQRGAQSAAAAAASDILEHLSIIAVTLVMHHLTAQHTHTHLKYLLADTLTQIIRAIYVAYIALRLAAAQ